MWFSAVKKPYYYLLVVLFSFAAACPLGRPASWISGGLITDGDESDFKEPNLYPASSGGFHIVYRRGTPSPWKVQYRTYLGGRLGPVRTVQSLGFLWGGDVCEAGNGDVFVVWENWDAQEQIWAARSRNGGVSWDKWDITQYSYPPDKGGWGKNPQVAPFGLGQSPAVVVTSWHAGDRSLYYGVFNGTSWSPHVNSGPWTDNFYAAWGSARHPVDGSVYRTYGRFVNNVWQVFLRRFDGTSWGSEQQVSTFVQGPEPNFVARVDLAISESGQIGVIWDDVNSVWARVYEPQGGWGPMTRFDQGQSGGITAIPGTNVFCAVHSADGQVWSREYIHGTWSGRSLVSVGMPSAFNANMKVCADNNGVLLSSWEFWGTQDGKPRGHYSVAFDHARADTTPPLPTFTATPTLTHTRTPTPTITNTPRGSRSPTASPTPVPAEALVFW